MGTILVEMQGEMKADQLRMEEENLNMLRCLEHNNILAPDPEPLQRQIEAEKPNFPTEKRKIRRSVSFRTLGAA